MLRVFFTSSTSPPTPVLPPLVSEEALEVLNDLSVGQTALLDAIQGLSTQLDRMTDILEGIRLAWSVTQRGPDCGTGFSDTSVPGHLPHYLHLLQFIYLPQYLHLPQLLYFPQNPNLPQFLHLPQDFTMPKTFLPRILLPQNTQVLLNLSLSFNPKNPTPSEKIGS